MIIIDTPESKYFIEYRNRLMMKMNFPDAWIKIHEEYYPVCTNVLKGLNFFDMLLSDVSNFKFIKINQY